MRFKKFEECDQQDGIRSPFAQLVSPDSGQVEEALGPSWFIKRCGQRS